MLNKKNFELYYREYYVVLCRFAHKYLDSEAESMDPVQDLFADLWYALEEIKITSSIKSYLYTSVRNRCLTRLKSKHGIESLVNENIATDPTNPDYPSLEAAVRQAIERLPEKCRLIFELSRDYDMKYSQIAEKLNLSEKTIENQISIALKKIRYATKEFLTLFL